MLQEVESQLQGVVQEQQGGHHLLAARVINRSVAKPDVFVQMSGVGYYPQRGRMLGTLVPAVRGSYE